MQNQLIASFGQTAKSLLEAQTKTAESIHDDMTAMNERLGTSYRIASITPSTMAHADGRVTYAAMVVFEQGLTFDSVELAEAPATMYGEEVAQAITDSAKLIAGEIDTGLRDLAKITKEISTSLANLDRNGVTAWKVDGERPPTE